MIQSEDYIYSKSAVARMLNIAPSLVIRVEKWATCAFVIIKNKRPRFWKKFDFLWHFADWRRKQSKELVVDRVLAESFVVKNPKKNSKYACTIQPKAIVCNCEDYKNQTKFLGKAGACKHGYAILTTLGIDKLSDYINQDAYRVTVEDFKKQNSAKLTTVRTDAYSFAIEGARNIYYCDLRPDFIKCSCTDSCNGQKFCTHGYAVLNYLGFTGDQQIKDYKLGYEWIVDDYINKEDEINAINQAMDDEGEELDRLEAEREAIEAARLAEEQDAKNCLITFKVGKTYSSRSPGDSGIKISFKILQKSDSFVTLETGKRCKIHSNNNVEFCYPEGQHSQCLILKADKMETEPTIAQVTEEQDAKDCLFTAQSWSF